MKKVISLLMLVVSVASLHAQKRKFESTAKKEPLLNPTTVPVKNASKVIPRYPDIIVTGLSIQKGGTGYFANFTLKNVGDAPVKKGLLSVQGYNNTTGSYCGGGIVVGIISEKEKLLNPGESISGTQKISLTGLTVGNTYTYTLTASIHPNSDFVESDKTNNQMQIRFAIQL